MQNIEEQLKIQGALSKKIRANLKTNYVQVPALCQKVSLYDYLKLARNSYYNAVNSFKTNNIQGAYIEFHKFQILVLERLPSHKDYNSGTKTGVEIRRWINIAREKAMKYLEVIVDKLDAEEYRAQLYTVCKDELDLIDEFEEVFITPPVKEPLPTVSVYGNQALLQLNPDSQRLTTLLVSECDRPNNSSTNNTLPPPPSSSAVTNNATALQQSHYSPDALPADIDYNSVDDLTDCDISDYEEHSLVGMSGLSNTDIDILASIKDYRSFYIPPPNSRLIEMNIGGTIHHFHQDDFHVSFGSFLSHLPVELQMTRSAIETNRCFFLHLGIATMIHPFVLQSSFRYYASIALNKPDTWYGEIVTSVNQYAGFVDANALSFLWPTEFDSFVICVVSGPLSKPILSCFAPAGRTAGSLEGLTEVFIRCDGSHFTLLKPYTNNKSGGFQILSYILDMAKRNNMLVQFNEVQQSTDGERSVRAAMKSLVK